MDVWFTELQHDGLRFSCQIKDVLYTGKSEFQEAAVYDTVTFGRLLTLDGFIMTSDLDEFIYHEMITHVPLMAHPNPERVLVIGGGDGGALREITKHPSVKLAHLVEIDELVPELSRRFFPKIAAGLDHPKSKISITDGIEYVKSVKNEYDVIIVDSTDPVGPSVGLFTTEFYKNAHDALKPDGILVAQTESPLFNPGLIREIADAFKASFPKYRLYYTSVPTYPSGFWCFSMGSKGPSGEMLDKSRFEGLETKFYTPEIHTSALTLPPFMQKIFE